MNIANTIPERMRVSRELAAQFKILESYIFKLKLFLDRRARERAAAWRGVYPSPEIGAVERIIKDELIAAYVPLVNNPKARPVVIDAVTILIRNLSLEQRGRFARACPDLFLSHN